MFADPIADITYATVAQTLPRVSTSGSKSVYRKNDGSLVITISHSNTGKNRIRSMARLDRNVDVNADSILENVGVYLVIDRPTSGFSETDVVNQVTCLTGFLTASTNAAIKKLNATES
jgi:hypothetical protein